MYNGLSGGIVYSVTFIKSFCIGVIRHTSLCKDIRGYTCVQGSIYDTMLKYGLIVWHNISKVQQKLHWYYLIYFWENRIFFQSNYNELIRRKIIIRTTRKIMFTLAFLKPKYWIKMHEVNKSFRLYKHIWLSRQQKIGYSSSNTKMKYIQI